MAEPILSARDDRALSLAGAMFASAVDALVTIDSESVIVDFSPGAERIFGHQRADILGRKLSVLLPDRFHQRHEALVTAFRGDRALSRGMGVRRPVLGLRQNGEEFRAEAALFKHGDGRAPRFSVLLRDLSERQWLNDVMERLQAAIADAGIGLFQFDIPTQKVRLSDACAGILGISGRMDLHFFESADLIDAADFDRVMQAVRAAQDPAGDGRFNLEYRLRTPAGAPRWVSLVGQTQFTGEGADRTPQLMIGILRDISERRQREARQALLLALSDAAASAPDELGVSQIACRLLRQVLAVDQVAYAEGQSDAWLVRAIDQDDRRGGFRSDRNAEIGLLSALAVEVGGAAAHADVATDLEPDGRADLACRAAGIRAFAARARIGPGELARALVATHGAARVWTDHERALIDDTLDRLSAVAERGQAARALNLSEQRYRGAFDNSTVGICEADPISMCLLRVNKSFADMVGFDRDELVGRLMSHLVHPAHHRANEDGLRALLAGQIDEFRSEKRYVRKDGSEFWGEATINLVRDAQGAAIHLVAIVLDVTEKVRARQELTALNQGLEERVAERTHELQKEMRNREEVQAALASAQRMEAIGRLTGGFAHDTNNMLTIIAGNLEMIEDAVAGDAPAQKFLREAMAGVDRLSQLNRRLLTFARQRRLESVRVDPGGHVRGLEEMLRRVLGDRIGLEIVGDDAGQVIVDPVELDNAILNLAFNARDAMPEGGRLLVNIHAVDIDQDAARGELDLRPGRYIVVSLTDTGVGMAADVSARAFEPFFTTKPQGKGTGLGLATVYGFVKQSGGHVSLYSEVGRGTTVNLYLPQVTSVAVEAGVSARASLTPKGAGELVLVVEDDRQVRALTCERLRRLNYRVLEAADAATALAVLERSPDIDAVFSDVVMGPGASGFELADMIEDRWPGRPVLLTSGFDMGAERNGFARFSGRVLQKPYNQSALAQAVRDILHGKPH